MNAGSLVFQRANLQQLDEQIAMLLQHAMMFLQAVFILAAVTYISATYERRFSLWKLPQLACKIHSK